MNKTALITGATRGIGKQIALTLAQNGYDIAINYRTENEALKETKKEIEQKLKEFERKLQKYDKEAMKIQKDKISEHIQKYLNIAYGGTERESYKAHKEKKINDKEKMVHDLKE